MTLELTFEGFVCACGYLLQAAEFQELSSKTEEANFSKVDSLLHLLCKMTLELTFKNFQAKDQEVRDIKEQAMAHFQEARGARTALEQQVTLQHTTTHCNTLQHTATHCNTL